MSEETFKYKSETFDGPLDLLLSLIQKNKVSIYDIPIAEILDQYVDYMEEMRSENIQIAAEFIVMAAELIYIKSKMLLPTLDEEEEDPRQKLAQALAEYKRYKTILNEFSELNKKAGITYTRKMQVIEFDKKHTRVYLPDKLADAYKTVIQRYKYLTTSPINNFKGIVGRQIASVKTKIILVGDAFQLPSVGPGLILSDLINSDLFNFVPLHFNVGCFRRRIK